MVSQDKSVISRAIFLSTQAREPAQHYEHNVIGYNYRMSNILAGVGRGQLRVLKDRVEARRKVFHRYRDGLAGSRLIKWMPEPEWSLSNRWLSACTIDQDASGLSIGQIIKRLSAELIEARPVWKPMQMQPVFANCKYFPHEGQSVSQRLFQQGMCLPSGSNLTEDQQNRVIEILNDMELR